MAEFAKNIGDLTKTEVLSTIMAISGPAMVDSSDALLFLLHDTVMNTVAVILFRISLQRNRRNLDLLSFCLDSHLLLWGMLSALLLYLGHMSMQSGLLLAGEVKVD